MTLEELLDVPPRVVSLGVGEFADALRAQGVEVVEVDWVPPPAIEPDLAALLEDLL